MTEREREIGRLRKERDELRAWLLENGIELEKLPELSEDFVRRTLARWRGALAHRAQEPAPRRGEETA